MRRIRCSAARSATATRRCAATSCCGSGRAAAPDRRVVTAPVRPDERLAAPAFPPDPAAVAGPARRQPAGLHPGSLAVGALLTALVALGQISTSIYIPSMPSLVLVFDTTSAAVSWTLSSFLLGFAVGQLVYGPLSDRFGRRPVLLAGLALYVAASVACVYVTTIEGLVVGRLLQGMTACAGPVLGRAVIRDIYGAERSAEVFAYVGVAMAVSPAVAPIIGGYLQTWFGWRATFWFLAAVGFLLLVLVLRHLAETNSYRRAGTLRLAGLGSAYVTLLRSPRFNGYVLAVAFVFAGLMAFTAGAPFVFIDVLGVSPQGFGMLLAFNVAGFLAGSIAAGRLTRRFGLDRLLLVGVGTSLVGGLAMVAFGLAGIVSVAVIVGPGAVFSLGMGIVLPNGMAGAMAPYPTIAGAASAVLGFVQMLVSTLAVLLTGAFTPVSQLPMAAVIAGCTVVAFAAFVMLVWQRPPAAGYPPEPR
ncbi:MAG: Bcr/CflA family efflux MFS transporter [Rhodospirillales bacterium]|nr:MAG: Bcr/CflA family efflux MFS transporter [Rhodospirillales bacterium]